MAFSLLVGMALLLVLGLLLLPRWVAHRRLRVRQHPFPAAWRTILRKRVPLVQRMPADLQLQLKKHIQVFIAEKAFIGCAGLRVTDEMRVVVAAQACLLLLNRPAGYFPHLRQILLYPGAFVVPRSHTDSAGVRQEGREALAGESWEQGQIVLSWQDCLEGAAVPDDGRNVVIHEFAHQLDQENGPANGAPPHAGGYSAHDPARWSDVFHAAYDQLRQEVFCCQEGLLDHYGAKDPAEFFAVVSEAFFEMPAALTREYPALYQELARLYCVDPAAW